MTVTERVAALEEFGFEQAEPPTPGRIGDRLSDEAMARHGEFRMKLAAEQKEKDKELAARAILGSH